jgi:hypothetical protein
LVLELIQSIPKLTRLEIYCTFDYTEPEPADSYATYASVTPLSSALTCVKDTLEHLKVGADLVIEDTELGVGTVTDFCSLKQLRCLQTVEIPFFVLLGRGPERPKLADVLPPSLRSLKFGDDVWPVHPLDFNQSLMMGKFVEFFGAGAWKETTPLLESVILSLCGYDQAFEDMRSREWRPNRGEREFRKLCTENGLQCEVLRYNSYNGRSEYRNVYIYDE